jgi:hypothetical protein
LVKAQNRDANGVCITGPDPVMIPVHFSAFFYPRHVEFIGHI